MLDFIKKQRIGNWITLVTLILTIVSFIIYGVNCNSVGYFKGNVSTVVILLSIFTLIILIAACVLPQLKMKEMVGKILSILTDILRIAAPVMLFASMLLFIGSRIEGLAYIFFSDKNVLAEVQTPENLSSANSAITGFIFYGISAIIALVATFFSANRKEEIE